MPVGTGEASGDQTQESLRGPRVPGAQPSREGTWNARVCLVHSSVEQGLGHGTRLGRTLRTLC